MDTTITEITALYNTISTDLGSITAKETILISLKGFAFGQVATLYIAGMFTLGGLVAALA